MIEERIIKENQDSITYGSKTKQGEIKVYGDFSNPEAFKLKIDKALEVRSYLLGKQE